MESSDSEYVVVETDLESNIRDLIEQHPFESENLTEVREVAIGNIDYNDDEQEETFLKSIVAAVREEEVEQEGEEEKIKEERKVSFVQAVTPLDYFVSSKI
ncbi:1627_t:CDS:2 [Paraglomus occultum]|uniref:1627_t:CDS:1 n=1 Tax=Paraglomus occultum TaxID=144539 RepID=A0A9N8VJE0_9GLOM|nr:1627_t:CDS:2 [Paraglomus occultum]